MAEEKGKSTIFKGAKLPILIEEALEDALIVSLNHGSKEYRGVLLDSNKGNIPHGVSWPSLHKKDGPESIANGEQKNQEPATTLRCGFNSENIVCKPTVRLIRDKNFRNIRLRPRRTLCSNCKSACLNTENGPVSVAKFDKSDKPIDNSNISGQNSIKLTSNIMQHKVAAALRQSARNLSMGLRSSRSSTANKGYASPNRTNNHLGKRKPLQNSQTVVPQIKIAKVDLSESRQRCMRWNLRRSITSPNRPGINVNRLTESARNARSSQPNNKKTLSRCARGRSTDTADDSRPSRSARFKAAKSVENRNNISSKHKDASGKKDILAVCDEIDSTETNIDIKTENSTLNDVDESRKLKSEYSSGNQKSSPMIRISIGDVTLLKIPPRAHSFSEGSEAECSSEDKIPTENTDVSESASTFENSGMSSELPTSTTDGIKECKANENDSNIDEKSSNKVEDRCSELHAEKKNVCTQMEDKLRQSVMGHHRKHKHKHKRKRYIPSPNHNGLTSVLQVSESGDHSKNGIENSEPPKVSAQLKSHRPRLLYTWRHNKGLSPRRDPSEIKALSPRREPNNSNIIISSKKTDSVLDSKLRKIYSSKDEDVSHKDLPEDVKSSTPHQSESSSFIVGDCLYREERTSDTDTDESGDIYPEPPPGNSPEYKVKFVQNMDVTSCISKDGHKVLIGDIVWGKIHGSPWWPGRVLAITSNKNNSCRQLSQVSWFGSSTMSYLKSTDLCPFLENFKTRYNKKKQGPYKMAIKLAAIAAQRMNSSGEVDFNVLDLQF